MSNNHWALLERIQQGLNKVSDLPPTMMLAVADRLEETIAISTRSTLEALAKQLADLFNTLLSVAPIATVNAVRGSASLNTAENAAYLLGQVSFAQLLAAQAAERRVDDGFSQAINDHRYRPYLHALFKQDCTGTELADETGERVETVSRKLKELRALGISDFRREGTAFCNFLTPAARAVLNDTAEIGQNSSMATDDSPTKNSHIPENIKAIFEELPDTYRKRPSFGLKEASDL